MATHICVAVDGDNVPIRNMFMAPTCRRQV
jgi:hypothetical protein